MDVRGQLGEDSSLLLPFHRLNSGHQGGGMYPLYTIIANARVLPAICFQVFNSNACGSNV